MVPVLLPYSKNHLQWASLMTDCLRADGLAEGTTFDPDPWFMQAALARLEKPQEGRVQPTGSDLMLRAMVAGDEETIKGELLRARQAGPTPRVSPLRPSLSRGSPQRPQQLGPLFSTPASSRPPSRFQPDRPRTAGYYSSLERSSGDDEQQEDQRSEVEVTEFMRKNAKALQMIRQTMHETLRSKFIKTKFAAVLWRQLSPVQDFDQCKELAEAGRALKLTHPSGWQAYI